MPNKAGTPHNAKLFDPLEMNRASIDNLRPFFLKSPTHNLPSQLSSFIGREHEIAQVKHLLSESRLVTLTGMGGCGKTRLAIRSAAGVAQDYVWGVCLVELAALTDPSFVPQIVALSLGVCEQPRCTLAETLVDYFRNKHLLLVLDNCEHVIGACAQLAESLLQACPQLSILATSREALGITGEFTFQVLPLSLPEEYVSLSFDTATQYEAARLFVERAAAVQPGFKLTSQNAAAVEQICRQLDGIPLAIELAAARVKTLTVEQIAARLAAHEHFHLLTIGSRTAMPRHQTLRGVVDWSFDLLAEKEQAMFKRLAVFAGGWSLESAEAICADADGILPNEVLDLLTQLVNKSLVMVEDRNGQARYRMLETLRQYAREKLIESGELDRIRDRLFVFFCKLVESAEPKLRGPEQITWFNRLETEYDNLRAALEWSLEGDDARADVGLQLAGSMYWFLFLRDRVSEGSVWFDRVLARSRASSASAKAIRAKALGGAGSLAIWQHDLVRATDFSEASLALFRELGDENGMGRALCNLAHVANSQQNYRQAAALGEESATLLRKAGAKADLAWALNALGSVAMGQRDYARAAAFHQESLALSREIGDKASIAWFLEDVGATFEYQGDFERALPLFEESLILLQELNSKFGIPSALGKLGEVALHQGNYEKAVTLCEASLRLFRELRFKENVYWEGVHWPLDLLGIAACRQGEYERATTFFKQALELNQKTNYWQGIVENLAGLGAVMLGQGQFESAVKLFGAVEALLESIAGDLGPADREHYARCVSAGRAQFDEKTFAKLWTAGRAMTMEKAIEYASAPILAREDQAQLAQPLLPRKAAKQEFGGLTRRERQVAAFVAQGKSNREIADELVLSERTVENHVGNILSKLGFNSRTQVAAWAVGKGLAKV